MEAIETTGQEQSNDTAQKLPLRTQRIAWMVLIGSFTLFILFCGFLSYGIYSFLFQSRVALNTSVAVARGSVGLVRTDLTESFELVGRSLSRGDTLLTDSQSQAVVLVRDNREETSTIAAITLKNNSRVVMRNASRPRFNWSPQGYRVSLTALDGEVDVWIPEGLTRNAGLSIALGNGAVVDISEAGSYTLSLNDTEITLTTRYGKAAILPPARENSRPVVNMQVGIYDLESGEVRVQTGLQDLLTNSRFIQPTVQAFNARNGASAGLPVMNSWNCSDRTADAPMGGFHQRLFDGRHVIQFLRADNAQNHGETACIQPFVPSGQIGQRVDGYQFLGFRTTFYVESHSLDGCGVQGSECPLMLLMDYVDIEGRSNQWFQGFYAQLRDPADYPLTCLSCQQEHKRVNPRTWYTYESGNLINLLPPERRPASILNVRFYASGHQYNVYMSELSLLVGGSDVPAPVGETS